MPSALQLLPMKTKTQKCAYAGQGERERKSKKCWEINKTKREGWHVCLSPPLPLLFTKNIKRQLRPSWWESHHLHQHHNGTSFINSGKKKKKEKKPLSIHFCWLDVGVESGHNQRCLSLSWKLFIFQELPKGFEQNWRHIRQSKNKNRMIRFKFFFPLICTTGRMYIEGKKYC